MESIEVTTERYREMGTRLLPKVRGIIFGYFTKYGRQKYALGTNDTTLIFSEKARNIDILTNGELIERMYRWRECSCNYFPILLFSDICMMKFNLTKHLTVYKPKNGTNQEPQFSTQFLSCLDADVKYLAILDLGPVEASEKEGIDTKLENIRWAVRRGSRALCGEDTISLILVESFGFPQVAAESAVYGTFYRTPRKVDTYKIFRYIDISFSLPEVSVRLVDEEKSDDLTKKAFRQGVVIGDCQNFARLLHGLGFHITPTDFINRIKERISTLGNVNLTVRDEAWIKEQKLDCILRVAYMNRKCDRTGKNLSCLQGSAFLLEFDYCGPTDAKRPIIFIGKASFYHLYEIYFWTEKRQAGKEYQNVSAGASIVGTILALARLKVPLCVKGVIPMCVHSLHLRKRTKLNCMDASDVFCQIPDPYEERLLLKDAFSYALTFCPEIIISLATQTNCLTTAFQYPLSVFYTFSDLLSEWFLKVCRFTGERFLRLPFVDTEDDIFDKRIVKEQFWITRTKLFGDSSFLPEIRNDVTEYVSDKNDYAFLTPVSLKDSMENKKWLHLELNKDLLINSDKDDEMHILHEVTGAPTRSLIEFCMDVLTDKNKMKALNEEFLEQ